MTKAKKTEAEDEAIGLHDILQNVAAVSSGGRALPLGDVLESEIADIVEAMHRHRKAGSLTLTLNFRPESLNELSISSSVKVKMPKAQAKATIAYVDKRGRLYGEDPNQMKIIEPTRLSDRESKEA